MTYELTNQEKADIINQHLRNLAFSKYNLELSKIEAGAIYTPEEVVSRGYDDRIAEVTSQIQVLVTELESLSL